MRGIENWKNQSTDDARRAVVHWYNIDNKLKIQHVENWLKPAHNSDITKGWWCFRQNAAKERQNVKPKLIHEIPIPISLNVSSNKKKQIGGREGLFGLFPLIWLVIVFSKEKKKSVSIKDHL